MWLTGILGKLRQITLVTILFHIIRVNEVIRSTPYHNKFCLRVFFWILGTTKHIETSWKAFPSVFKFFENKLNQRLWARSRPQSAPSTPSSPEGMKMAADFSQSPASIPPVFEAPNTPERAANQSPDKTLLSLQESKDVAFDVFMASPGVPEVPEGINDSNVQRDLPQVPEPMSPDPSSPAPAGNPESGNENPTEGRRLNNKEPVEHEEKSSEAKNTKTKF